MWKFLKFLTKRLRATGSGERIYAVGDIHGRADLFLSLLHSIQRDRDDHGHSLSTRIVLLGDLIDRGPSSRQVIELARQMEHRFEAFVVLSGNHEEMLLQSANGNGTMQNLWFDNGGLATLQSYDVDVDALLDLAPPERGKVISDAIGKPILRWLKNLPVSYRSGNYFFCHAGVRPGRSLDEQAREDLLWIRDEFLDSSVDHGALVVHGHTETMHVEELENRLNIDTAAYRTGVLTAVGLEQDRRWFLEATVGN